MKRSSLIVLLFAALLVLPGRTESQVDIPILLGKHEAYVLGQSRVIESRGIVEQCQFWGDTLLYVMLPMRFNAQDMLAAAMGELREPAVKVASVCRWTPKFQSGFEIWRFDPQKQELSGFAALPGSDTVICRLNSEETLSYVAITNAVSPSAARAVSLKDLTGLEVTFALDGPYFASERNPSEMWPEVTVYDALLNTVARVDTRTWSQYKGVWFTGFADQGKSLNFAAKTKADLSVQFKLDWSTGRVSEVPSIERRPEPSAKDVLVTWIGQDDKVSKGYLSVGGETHSEELLLAAPCSYITLDHAKRRVAYVTDGILNLREIKSADLKSVAEVAAKRDRAKAISEAKQVALALLMYSNDFDDSLPGSGPDWRERVMPYLRNADILARFNYTFTGGDLTKIDRPEEQELGFIPCPGGRAVAYADGHVKFVPDKR